MREIVGRDLGQVDLSDKGQWRPIALRPPGLFRQVGRPPKFGAPHRESGFLRRMSGETDGWQGNCSNLFAHSCQLASRKPFMHAAHSFPSSVHHPALALQMGRSELALDGVIEAYCL